MDDPRNVELDDLIPILYQERNYSTPLTAKAFHKLIYFIHQELSTKQDIESNISLFWYKYGACARTTPSTLLEVVETGDRHEVKFNKSDASINFEGSTESTVRATVNDVLEMYYENGLEGITDLQYDEAPYQVQRDYREIDKLIGSIKSLNGEQTSQFDRDGFRSLLHNFISSYPVDVFPEHENELYHCYSILSERLDNTESTIEDLERILDTFWSLFCVDLAESTATNTNSMSVLSDLGITDPQETKDQLREQIHDYDQDYLTVSESTEAADEAAEAVMISRLGAD